MPIGLVKRNRLWRLVEPGGAIAKTRDGVPRDGGGHFTRRKALAQQRAMNRGK